MTDVWPNFFIVGAARSGTTSLYEYLKKVPGIFMSPVKEPHYFVDEIGPALAHTQYSREEKKYLSLFSGAKKRMMRGEASTSYLWDTQAPSKISNTIPNAKIIILLRDPIQRAYSQYLLELRNGYEIDLNFLSAIKKDYYGMSKKGWGFSRLYVELSMYYEQVYRYISKFGREKVKVIIFEDEFKPKTQKTVQETVNFLGILYDIPENWVSDMYNSAVESFALPKFNLDVLKTHRFQVLRRDDNKLLKLSRPVNQWLASKFLVKSSTVPPLREDAITFLGKIFSEDVLKLSKLLSDPPSWTNRYKL